MCLGRGGGTDGLVYELDCTCRMLSGRLAVVWFVRKLCWLSGCMVL